MYLPSLHYVHNGVLLSHKKKKEVLPSVTSMNLEGIMLSEISQAETDIVDLTEL